MSAARSRKRTHQSSRPRPAAEVWTAPTDAVDKFDDLIASLETSGRDVDPTALRRSLGTVPLGRSTIYATHYLDDVYREASRMASLGLALHETVERPPAAVDESADAAEPSDEPAGESDADADGADDTDNDD